jgi:hypothetical protein
MLDGKIIECRFCPTAPPTPTPLDGTWRFECIRGDKSAPNKLSTALKTWENIVENLSLTDIFPEGTLSEETRQKLADWERTNPTWRANPGPTYTAAVHMAPAPLPKLASFY